MTTVENHRSSWIVRIIKTIGLAGIGAIVVFIADRWYEYNNLQLAIKAMEIQTEAIKIQTDANTRESRKAFLEYKMTVYQKLLTDATHHIDIVWHDNAEHDISPPDNQNFYSLLWIPAGRIRVTCRRSDDHQKR